MVKRPPEQYDTACTCSLVWRRWEGSNCKRYYCSAFVLGRFEISFFCVSWVFFCICVCICFVYIYGVCNGQIQILQYLVPKCRSLLAYDKVVMLAHFVHFVLKCTEKLVLCRWILYSSISNITYTCTCPLGWSREKQMEPKWSHLQDTTDYTTAICAILFTRIVWQ